MQVQFKSTQKGNSYWASNGAFQEEYDELYKKFVPQSGAAETLNGELIRSISRLFYEYCNNGNCNACDQKWGEEEYECYACRGTGTMNDEDEEGNEIEVDGSGYESEEVILETNVSPFYGKMLELIQESVPGVQEDVSKVEKFIKRDLYNDSNQFSEQYMQMYNTLCDKVIFYVLTNEDKELPNWYERD